MEETGESRFYAGRRGGWLTSVRHNLDPDRFRQLGLAAVFGVALSLFLHFMDGSPASFSIVTVLARPAIAIALILGGLWGIGKIVMLGSPVQLGSCLLIGAALIVAAPFGPYWIPPETVPGTYEATYAGLKLSGNLDCEWAPGRYRLAGFVATDYARLGDGSGVRIRAQRDLPQILAVERVAADGTAMKRLISIGGTPLDPGRGASGEIPLATNGARGSGAAPLYLEGTADPLHASSIAELRVTWACTGP